MHNLHRVGLVGVFLVALASSTFANQDTAKVRRSVLRITGKLDLEEVLHIGLPVTFSAIPEKNRYTRRYQKLVRKAKTEELVALTSHQSKMVKLYAFNALMDRRYRGLRAIYLY